MPRGGRRKGAGAPKGNLNGMRSGKYSQRALMVLAMHAVRTDRREIFYELYARGFYPPPTYQFNGDYKGWVRYLYWRFYDSADPRQSDPIKPKQMPPLPARFFASIPAGEVVTKPETGKIENDNSQSKSRNGELPLST